MNKKFIRVLGFGVGLFLAGSLSVNAQKVSFNGERLSLKQAFEKIESVSKYKIAYNTSQLDVNKQVVLNQKNQDVLQILSDLLKGTNCVYQVNDNYIVITLKDDEKVKKIKGTIKDSAGEPIIGANVILKGDATVGSITDIDGNFDLSVPSNATLQVSYIGYNTQDVPIGNKSFLNITLKEDTETLDEVVVVGYGSQKKVNVIGSIASVDSKALESRAVPDVSNMLTGQMSGVTITQESGNPGQDAGTIRIRGVGSFGATPSPLVLVDGLPGSLSDLTPADIDNISVLKDASSAAIYGSRAANGVILVTTKKGKEGKARIIYNGSVGMSQATELPELAHSYEYAEFYNKAIGTETYTPEMIQKYRDGSDPDNYADEMYLDDLLGGHALQTKHELSVSGGKALWKDENIADSITTHAIDFIKQHKDEPFFMYFATNDVHVPRFPHDRFRGKNPMGVRGDAIVQFDWSVGQIMETLDKLGLAENTLIILSSDNGPVVDDGYDDKAEELLNGHSPAGPWRGNKYSAFEGGTAVPAIVRWPKKIKENRESDVLMSQIDWISSLGALINARLPKGSAPDSYNRIGNLLGTDNADRPWVIELASNHVLSVRTKDWKYIEPNDGPAMIQWGPKIETGNSSTPQLYDMRKDINERANIILQHPKVVYDMQNILRRVRNKTIKME
ncbi:SusC/RagA family TonB-linked outer membrane protein [Phocaeicola vulgatus]|uniref:SusC/RagA family TonB-linked outer membrane protein n=1 Tax=Phocaeicola vulgatus TaxID=821 RepID=UPI001C37FACD|nr:SusC/RagA family TonB-linked outer membrane protein [Phocaeicola vulgatus]MBV4210259.1 SusC/RagA family TonB-linked outer membrane protein [Phocaeicola vulgatus]MBV4214359.1 SusC/RagA family TonB-linked outer membrane protein [Phocaeicola vulgatus]MCB6674173.1 SusC/RagA family TonB-linked outer membrane protein [Phocaeicola vulgatus]MCB6758639.1 SusC/RagA family TonB-linked outer membrane protein [Phocaeicola vulgatus]MCB6768563.1 SusC/RagA family TonB-linked outer membrane protein [Phocaei